MLDPRTPIDFIAKIYLTKTEEGGRRSPASDVWRPTFKLANYVEMTSTNLRFIDKDLVGPEEDVTVEVQIISKESFSSLLFSGLQFELREGSRLVANGEILSVLNQNLLKP